MELLSTNQGFVDNWRASPTAPKFDNQAVRACYVVFAVLLLSTPFICQEFLSLDHYLIIGAMFQTFAFILLAMNLNANNSTIGISKYMLFYLGAAYSFRLLPAITMTGYVPAADMDRLLYIGAEFISLGLCGYAINMVRNSRTYDAEQDKFPFLPATLVCCVLAAITKSDANQIFWADWFWMLSQYLECVAIVPQLFLVSRIGSVENVTSHYMMNLILSRVVYGIFWVTVRMQYDSLPGYFQIGISLLNLAHLLFCGDFIFYFVKSVNKGGQALVF